MLRNSVVLFAVLTVTSASAESIKVPRVRFIRQNAAYQFFLPIKIKVKADDVRNMDDVRVRVFANRTAESVKTLRLGETESGCYILRSRVEPYDPSLVDPDILLRDIYDMDFRCVNGKLAPTPFVLVIESVASPDSQFLKIDPAVVGRYFRYLYSFTVIPPANHACRTAAPPRPVIAGSGSGHPARPPRVETARAVTADLPQDDCIKTVE